MNRHDLQRAGYTVERAMTTHKPSPTGNKTHNILLLKRNGRQYIAWSFDFPSQLYTEPQLITKAMLAKAGGLP